MKKFALLSLAMLLVTLMFVPSAFADGIDNECNEGGAMAGKCDTEWEWTCGWYLARFNRGELNYQTVPATCVILLPPPPAAVIAQLSPEAVSQICKLYPGFSNSTACAYAKFKTGTVDNWSDGSINFEVVFYTSPQPCPPGYTDHNVNSEPTGNNFFWSDPVFAPIIGTGVYCQNNLP